MSTAKNELPESPTMPGLVNELLKARTALARARAKVRAAKLAKELAEDALADFVAQSK